MNTEFPMKRARVPALIFLTAMHIIKQDRWLNFKKLITTYLHAKKTQPQLVFLTRKSWNHVIGEWSFAKATDVEGEVFFKGVKHHDSGPQYTLPYNMAVPGAALWGRKLTLSSTTMRAPRAPS